MNCPYCGSDEVEYHGVTNDGGDYGESLCDEFGCLACGAWFEANCIEAEADDEEMEEVE